MQARIITAVAITKNTTMDKCIDVHESRLAFDCSRKSVYVLNVPRGMNLVDCCTSGIGTDFVVLGLPAWPTARHEYTET
jgi:hypothetical protein